MAKNASEGVRIGPISLLTLISVLLLAVLAMLCVTTTNATDAMASRQAESTSDTYAVDSCGQAMIAQIDGVVKASGGSAQSAVSRINSQMSSLCNEALLASGADDVQITGQVSGTSVAFTVASDSGKTLSAALTITGNSYTVTEWKMTNTQEQPEETLWSGLGSSR